MDLAPHVDALRRHLAVLGLIGGPEAAKLIERLADGIEDSVRLAVQGAVVAAAEEVTAELAPGSVEVRLRGRDLAFVVTLPDPSIDDATLMSHQPADVREAAGPDSGPARISFRPPEQLKARIEEAADRTGLSVNAFLVSTLTAALATTASPPRRTAGQSAEGWFV